MTELSRRNFLKKTGVAAGVGGSVVRNSSAKAAVHWGMIVDLQRCVGCKGCTAACKAENHTPPGVTYNVVLEEEIGTYPDVRRKFTFVPCQHCRKSSCVTVCPTKATYHREDGIVVVDYDRCIGCRYCVAACPYSARSFDFGHNYHEDMTSLGSTNIGKDFDNNRTPYEKQSSPEYGENRKRSHKKSPIGNVRKCSFCLHRLKKDLAPACAATCMGRAIHFGNLNDPDARCIVHGEKLHRLLVSRGHMRLKEELGNDPSVYYLT